MILAFTRHPSSLCYIVLQLLRASLNKLYI